MNTNKTEQNETNDRSQSGGSGHTPGHGKRRLVALAACISAISGVLAFGGASAHAAAPYWKAYDVQTGDRCSVDFWILIDGYGRATADALFDFNGDCAWDSRARDTNSDGKFDEVWFDSVNPGGGWDILIWPSQRWDTQNGTDRWGTSYPGPYGTQWATTGYTSASIGGSAPTTATAGGAFWNLMVNMAARSGIAVWS
jgi:hypothetical protein